MKKINILALILIFLLIISGCSSKPQSSEKPNEENTNEDVPKEVRIGYQVIPNAELLAKQLGSVEKKFPNTKITWLEFDSGRDVNTAIASENIDLGLVGSVPLATGIANNLPYQVYFIHDVIGDAESLVVREDTGIESIKDVAGKKIAVPFGSTAHFSLLTALNKAGIDPNQLSVLDMQPQDILAAWQRGDIDGAFVWHPTLGKILEDNGSVLLSAEKLAEEGVITSDTGVVQKKFADKYPSFIKEYISVLDESINLYREDPKKAAKTLAPALGLTEEQTLQQMEGLIWLDYSEQKASDYLGTNEETGQFANVLESTGQFLKDQAIIPSSPDLSTYQSAILHLK
ncbi:ABC transporter substrate-binding protein [Metabacillus fastidiosus]|uniref:taurine ABC transporter substrate-binding protein n=1 Tax=Metabacillus fastidiosus TaxID=1458 RepID=UPI002E1AFC66|nr:ABC transporter substrate-binding protein [Metabacillus fastidiosus]